MGFIRGGPSAPIIGNPQTTPTVGHDLASQTLAEALAAQPGVEAVTMNRALRTAVDLPLDRVRDLGLTNVRPDVVTLEQNMVRIFEIQSSGQATGQGMVKLLKSAQHAKDMAQAAGRDAEVTILSVEEAMRMAATSNQLRQVLEKGAQCAQWASRGAVVLMVVGGVVHVWLAPDKKQAVLEFGTTTVAGLAAGFVGGRAGQAAGGVIGGLVGGPPGAVVGQVIGSLVGGFLAGSAGSSAAGGVIFPPASGPEHIVKGLKKHNGQLTVQWKDLDQHEIGLLLEVAKANLSASFSLDPRDPACEVHVQRYEPLSLMGNSVGETMLQGDVLLTDLVQGMVEPALRDWVQAEKMSHDTNVHRIWLEAVPGTSTMLLSTDGTVFLNVHGSTFKLHAALQELDPTKSTGLRDSTEKAASEAIDKMVKQINMRMEELVSHFQVLSKLQAIYESWLLCQLLTQAGISPSM